MLSFLQQTYERLESIPLCPENESHLREEIHLLLTLAHLCAGSADQTQKQTLAQLTQGCHKILRKLENLLLCRKRELTIEPCAFVDFLDDICSACDLLLSGGGKRVLFHAELRDTPRFCAAGPVRNGLLIGCAPGPLRCAVLNLIANAALYSQEDTTLVRLAFTPGHALVTVRSGGETPLPALQRGTDTTGAGLCAVRRCVELHRGTLLFQSDEGCTAAALALPRGLEARAEADPLPQPDFVEYICDRLSPVYTGLCGLCPCPV